MNSAAITALADPPVVSVDAHLLEYLSIELIKQLTLSSAVARSRTQAQERSAERTNAESTEGVASRLDAIGFKLGWALAERLSKDRPRFPAAPSLVPSASAPAPAPSTTLTTTPDPLETIKFICKDIWIALYDKQIDNLRTNHRGVYVLQDNSFPPLLRISGNAGETAQIGAQVKLYLAEPCGIIRGALANIGVPCTVTAESSALPQSTFQIKTMRPGGV